MLTLFALSLASAPLAQSPAHRFDAAADAAFTASVSIRRGAGVGRDRKPPKDARPARMATIEDAAGQPHPALIYDFE